jgi:glycosyltransferase involved in cell wall biosynthesis
VEWARSKLHVRSDRIWYIPNFVCLDQPGGVHPTLPGKKGARIVCVANFRRQKDHFTLLEAMAIVARSKPEAHLVLIGSPSDIEYYRSVRQVITERGLGDNVSLLGVRPDISAILRFCDIGVLSSVSEAFPLVLLEYGLSGLATVATAVGQCPELLNEGADGVLVPPNSPKPLAEALLTLLTSPERRKTLGGRLFRRVQERYGRRSIIEQICTVYDRVCCDPKDARN